MRETQDCRTDVGGEIVDFDEALLDACPPSQMTALMADAALLAEVFAPERRAPAITALACEIQSGVRELETGRAHGLVAAALRRLARDAPP